MIPVVISHRLGVKDIDQGYLKHTIQQAQEYNHRVVLIGDNSNTYIRVEHHHLSKYNREAETLATHYEHMSYNRAKFQLWDIQRHFLYKAFMRAESLNKIFTCDSDVMVYSDVTEVEKTLGSYDVALSVAETQWKYRWAACAHVSYWTLDTLTEFCEYAQRAYTTPKLLAKLREKWGWHQRENKPGGVCDMTLLWLFSRGKNVVNLAQVRDGATFDDNINVSENYHPDEYRMKAGRKEITWDDNQPYGWNLRLRRPIRFHALHFQSNPTKALVPHYYRRRP